MAEKTFTITLKVDLDCPYCYKNIRKILCKLQDRENIQTISFDDKKKMVTVTGPFSTTNMAKKLVCNCRGYKSIKEIQIIEQKPPPPKEEPPKLPEKKEEKPKPVPVIVQVCAAGQVCRCNLEGSCGWCCREGPGGWRPCSCGCGGVYRPCSCGCGRGYAPAGSFCGGYKMPYQVIIEDQPGTCTIM